MKKTWTLIRKEKVKSQVSDEAERHENQRIRKKRKADRKEKMSVIISVVEHTQSSNEQRCIVFLYSQWLPSRKVGVHLQKYKKRLFIDACPYFVFEINYIEKLRMNKACHPHEGSLSFGKPIFIFFFVHLPIQNFLKEMYRDSWEI